MVTRKKKPAGRRAAKKRSGAGLLPGPRKNRLPLLKVRRSSAHKIRARWFQARTAWPWREPSVQQLARERRRAARTLAGSPGAEKWECIGPTNIGGRLTCIAVRPDNPDRLLAGAAGGGVWRSNDAGRSWKPLWHRRDLNVGALARDPRDPDIVYCGTGEANLSADSYPGVGLYRSANDGRSWTLLASSARTGIPSRIGAIAVDPFDSKHLKIGGVGYSDEVPGGLYTTRDGGINWTRESFISRHNYWCHTIVFHPTSRGVVYATITERGSRNGIWMSADGGASWRQLRQGLPDPARCGRISLAIALSDPRVIYTQIAGENEGVLGVFRSPDGGSSWKDIAGAHFRDEDQMSYGNAIAVRPDNPDCVICGGVDLHLTTDGGRTWRRATRWDADRGAAAYAHADHHALVIPSAAPARIFDVNDGGLDVSEDGGRAWSNRSNGLAVTMFYDVDVAQSDPRALGGGAQDNGTLVTKTGSAGEYFELLGGDGGWILYDPGDGQRVFATYQFMGIWRFDRRNPDGVDITPPAPRGERESVWMVFTAMDPVDPRRVYAGSTRVWRTSNGGGSWQAISPHLDSSPISAIEVATADPKRLYVGTENGGIFRSADRGRTWSANLAGAELPGVTITRIESSPRDADLVFATAANFGHSHVFRSHDGAMTWSDVDRGRLPDVPHHAVAIQSEDPKRVYVCNDAGVFVSVDGGENWRSLTRNLPYVPVVDLVYRGPDRTLTAATYGRSLWRIHVGAG